MKELIIQSINGHIVTIAAGKSPAIYMEGDYAHYAPAAINFLRSGCPRVQLIDLIEDKDFNEGFFKKFEKAIRALEIGKELFMISQKFPVIDVSMRVD